MSIDLYNVTFCYVIPPHISYQFAVTCIRTAVMWHNLPTRRTPDAKDSSETLFSAYMRD